MHLYVFGINLGLKNRSTNSGVFWSKNGRSGATFGTTFDTCNGDRAGSEPKGSLMVHQHEAQGIQMGGKGDKKKTK